MLSRMAAIRGEVREGGIEYQVSINEEEEEEENHPMITGIPPDVRSFLHSESSENGKKKTEDDAIKKNPIDCSVKTTLPALSTVQVHPREDQQCASTIVNKEPEGEENTRDNRIPSTTDANVSSIHRSATLHALLVEDEEATSSNQPVHSLSPSMIRKQGRPILERFSEEEMAADPKKRRLMASREAANRYREKKKVEVKNLQNREIQERALNEHLKARLSVMTRGVSTWRRLCRNAFGFTPMPTHQSPIAITSASRSTQSVTPGSVENALSLLAECFKIAPSMQRAMEKEEERDLIRQQEEELTVRNAFLRSQALQLYAEIINLRKMMRFEGVKTSVDEDLPVPSHST